MRMDSLYRGPCVAALMVLVVVGASARPLRQLRQLGYVPQNKGCDGLIVTVTGSSSWWHWARNEPSIQGTVQLQNPKEYGFPITYIQVIAESSDGLTYSVQADCQNGPGTFVPANPIPFTYGTASCTYDLQLDQRVFSSYSSPGLSSSGSASGQLSYFPSNNGQSQPTWTVTAVATIGLSNAQCPSQPESVDTQSWWSWFTSWFSSSRNASTGTGSVNNNNISDNTVTSGSLGGTAVASNAAINSQNQAPGSFGDTSSSSESGRPVSDMVTSITNHGH